MAKDSNSAVSLLAAGVIAVTGLIPVAWILTTPEPESVVEQTVVVDETTTTAAEATTVVVETVPELGVDGLDPAVVRVLQANGYAELTPEEEVAAELSPAVTRVLIERGAVLTVVEDDPTATGG